MKLNIAILAGDGIGPEMMSDLCAATARKIVAVLVLSCSVANLSAQSKSELRDSLKVAIDRMEYAPDSVDLRLQKASYNLQLEQWSYALDEYNYVLRRNPYNLAALLYRAYTNEKLHRYNFARLDYENMLTIVPGNFEGQLGLALLNQKDKHHTEALDQINRLVSQYPDSALAYAARAGIEKEQGMVSLAVYDYKEAIAREPGNTEYRIDYIDVLLMDKKKNEARRELDALVSMGVSRAALLDLYKRCK